MDADLGMKRAANEWLIKKGLLEEAEFYSVLRSRSVQVNSR
jgi:hypothetical protein